MSPGVGTCIVVNSMMDISWNILYYGVGIGIVGSLLSY